MNHSHSEAASSGLIYCSSVPVGLCFVRLNCIHRTMVGVIMRLLVDIALLLTRFIGFPCLHSNGLGTFGIDTSFGKREQPLSLVTILSLVRCFQFIRVTHGFPCHHCRGPTDSQSFMLSLHKSFFSSSRNSMAINLPRFEVLLLSF